MSFENNPNNKSKRYSDYYSEYLDKSEHHQPNIRNQQEHLTAQDAQLINIINYVKSLSVVESALDLSHDRSLALDVGSLATKAAGLREKLDIAVDAAIEEGRQARHAEYSQILNDPLSVND